jgi:hypothetical protein
LNLNKLQAITLAREVQGSVYYEHVEPNCYLGTVTLTEELENLDQLNIYHVRQQILLHDCDILISVTTDNTLDTIETPRLVNKLLKHIDCKITFSFKKS